MSFDAIRLLVVRALLLGVANPFYNITAASLRQAMAPERLQGRLAASMDFISVGTLPIGALIAGGLGQAISLWPTLVIAALGELLTVLWLFLSPAGSLGGERITLGTFR